MTCPSCGEPTLDTPTGHLNPTPGRLGRHNHDGTEQTPDEIRSPAVRGYYPHHCPPPGATKPTAKRADQGSLF